MATGRFVDDEKVKGRFHWGPSISPSPRRFCARTLHRLRHRQGSLDCQTLTVHRPAAYFPLHDREPTREV